MAVAAVMAFAAVGCKYDPAQFTDSPPLSECLGRTATIGVGWVGAEGPDGDDDGRPGKTYRGTEGDDVVVVVSGPVVFEGLGGNDIICINQTNVASAPGPIVVDAGTGDDVVWDRRFRNMPAPAGQTVEVALGPGADRFYGSAIDDTVDAGEGDDEVNGGGGVDTVVCGPGNDVRWVGDYTDPGTSALGCETEQAGIGPVDEAAVQTRLETLVADTGVPGAQVGIRIPGQPDVVKAVGIDDVNAEPPTPMPTDGTYQVASITKTFTSAITLQLVEDGQLSFDDTLDQWLPDYPNADAITIRMLLDHTSGIFSYEEALDSGTIAGLIFGEGPDHEWTFEELLARNATYPPADVPGASWHYSNGNYWALGYIIEAATGQSIKDVFDQRIIQPYGLDDTVLDDGTASITQHGWLGSVDFLDLPRTPFMTWFSTAGAVVSSTQDLLRWGEVLYGGQFLGPAMDAELHTLEHAPWPPDDDRYGLGVEGVCPCSDPLHPEMIGHNGGFPGTRTNLRYDSASGITTVFRANTYELTFADMDQFVQDLYALVKAG